MVVTKEKIAEAAEVVDAHLGPGMFNVEGKSSLVINVCSKPMHHVYYVHMLNHTCLSMYMYMHCTH